MPFGEPIEKVRVFREEHRGQPCLLGEITRFTRHMVATFYDGEFENELSHGIHDHSLSDGLVLLEHGAVFIDALERRYRRSTTTWLSRVPLQ
jgi:hypothetical protein